MLILKGQTYIARNQGTAITPRDIAVTVEWVNHEDVWYTKEQEKTVQQTTRTRFEEIVAPATDEESHDPAI